jgi:NAD(P)-dependent dehydrogenase (short-subunit alcohol dehydrogenase family)
MATILIVGADKGIAHCMVQQLTARGEDVYASCLQDGAETAKAGGKVIPHIDVTSDDDVAKLRRALEGVELDWLVHVAGVLGVDELGKIDLSDVRRQFEINAMGPLRTVQALLGNLGEGAKVGVVTSRVGSLSDNGSGGMYAYRMSKAAANMATLNLHHDLAKRGIAVVALHPGLTATDRTKEFPRDLPWITPEAAAEGLIRNMDNLAPENAGRFQHSNGEYLPW